MIESLRTELLHAFRSVLRTPALSLVVMLTLAIGIGANATIFSVLDALMFKPLPVAKPRVLHILYENAPDSGDVDLNAAPAGGRAFPTGALSVCASRRRLG